HQFQIDVGDIVDAVEPVRQRRFAETGMRRCDHPAPVVGEHFEERHIDADAGAAVQIENRGALPALEQFQLDTGHRDHIRALARGSRLAHDGHCVFRWYGPSSALAFWANDMSITSLALILPVTQPCLRKKSRSFWMPAAFTAPVTSTACEYISRISSAFMLKLLAMIATTSSEPGAAILPSRRTSL